MKQGEGDYNGWKNRQTWNVALWINGELGLYKSSVRYSAETGNPSYAGFIDHMGLAGLRTPDGVSWLDSNLDYQRLDEMIVEQGKSL